MSDTPAQKSAATTVSADEAEQQRRGLMLVLSSPSGAGKSTIARLLLDQEENLELSISVTTRPRRSSEVDGVHYHFLDPKRFEQMREHDELLEWAEVHGNYYATPRGPVEDAIESGRDILFDIDIQGTFQLYEKMRSGRCFNLHPAAVDCRNEVPPASARRRYGRSDRQEAENCSR